MTNRLLLLISICFFHFYCSGQWHCKWTQSVKKISANDYDLVFNAEIDKGWYIHSSKKQDSLTPFPTVIRFDPSDAFLIIDSLKESEPLKQYSDIFGVYLFIYKNKATFTQRIRIKKEEKNRNSTQNKSTSTQTIHIKKEEKITIKAYIEYQIDNDSLNQASKPPTIELDFEILRQ